MQCTAVDIQSYSFTIKTYSASMPAVVNTLLTFYLPVLIKLNQLLQNYIRLDYRLDYRLDNRLDYRLDYRL